MKKTRIISTLAAAVVALTPLTGITQQVIYNGGSSSQLTAYADNLDGKPWPLDRVNSSRGKNSYTISFEGNYLFKASNTEPIMKSSGKNGHIYGFFLTTAGRLVVKEQYSYAGHTWWNFKKTIATPFSGFDYSNCWLAFQWDGNVVIYAHEDYRYPVWWCGNQPHVANKGNKYTFTFTDSAQLKVAYNGYVCKTIG